MTGKKQALHGSRDSRSAGVKRLPPTLLFSKVGNSRHDHARLIYGAASHDLYHTGQISLIKRLRESASRS